MNSWIFRVIMLASAVLFISSVQAETNVDKARDALAKKSDDADSTRQLEEVFQAVEKNYSLLKSGGTSLSYSLDYSYISDSRIDIDIQNNVVRNLDINPSATHSFTNSFSFDYGILNNLTLNAISSLDLIIHFSTIAARSPFGYFNYSVPYNGRNLDSQVKRSWLQSVCFTETPVDHIHIQFQNIVGRRLQFHPYGLAFFENSIRSKNGSPVMYFDTNNRY